MKAGKEHRVPLPARAVAILEALPREGDYVFLGARSDKPLSNMAMLELVRGMRRDTTVHGFRSTFRDWAAETTAYPHEMCEIALAHTVGNKVEAAYRRGDMMEKRAASDGRLGRLLPAAAGQVAGERRLDRSGTMSVVSRRGGRFTTWSGTGS